MPSLRTTEGNFNLDNDIAWYLGEGESMIPLLSSSQLLRAKKCAPESISPADLVIFRNEDKNICHRVLLKKVRRGRTWYFLSGSNVRRADGWVRHDQITGRVFEVDGKNPYQGKWKLKLLRFHLIGLAKLFWQKRILKQ